MGDANIPGNQIKEIVLSQRRLFVKEEEATILSLSIDDPEKSLRNGRSY